MAYETRIHNSGLKEKERVECRRRMDGRECNIINIQILICMKKKIQRKEQLPKAELPFIKIIIYIDLRNIILKIKFNLQSFK